MAALRRVGAAIVRWPWVVPALAVIVIGVAGELGRGWLYGALGGVGLGVLGVGGWLYLGGRGQ